MVVNKWKKNGNFLHWIKRCFKISQKKKKKQNRKGSSDSDGKILTAILNQFAVPFKKKKKKIA